MAGIKTMNLRRSAMLGVALAALAVPVAAMAQDAEGRARHGMREAAGEVGERPTWRPAPTEQRTTRSDDGGQRRGGGQARAADTPQPAAARPQPQPQVQAQAQGDARASGGWRGRGDSAGSTGWRGRGNASGDAQAQARAQADAQARAQAAGAQARGGSDGRGWAGRDRDNRGDAARQGAWQGRNGTYTDPQRNGAYRDANRDGRPDNSSGSRDGNRDGWRSGSQWRGNSSGYNGSSRSWNRDWRRDNRYNWSSYRSSHRSLFNIGVYYSPYRNYSYRRLDIGFFLDSLFYSDRYWIDDPYQYRLPEVYGPYRWVRYYDDALLVDIYSGEVIDVIHDFFW